MCGRFAITLPVQAMAHMFEATAGNDLPEVPNFNVCPTNDVHTTIAGAGRRLMAMRWGFIPSWYKSPSDGPLLINARAETIAEKPAFREACRQRRCIIPATGFYEWTKDAEGKRHPWYIRRRDEVPLAFAGIWQDWDNGETQARTCAIVTCGANTAMSAIHHRMPVILSPDDFGLWLGEQGHGAARLMRPAPEAALVWHRVDPKVNSNRAEGPELIEPIA
ncbi:SOS response-associated peptidase [Donghicola mangrovi]|uniref:Abasic site processing protein n=1 Tax=Donghicola mangrovi TaxID=2729614 RepID=A0A850Q519_9RHOB|nr:SOS response-associated peptidase [Donghicola mangrovi]NVO24206.1 SOS response-associated peptidase [Donghicola mangrovi]